MEHDFVFLFSPFHLLVLKNNVIYHLVHQIWRLYYKKKLAVQKCSKANEEIGVRLWGAIQNLSFGVNIGRATRAT